MVVLIPILLKGILIINDKGRNNNIGGNIIIICRYDVRRTLY
jgi:hypothetical protein